MTKFNTMAFLAASALALTAVPAQAQYRASPAQSLSGSCQDIETLNSGYVTAVCRANDGRWRWSSIYYPHCRSDIANRDGVLSCVGAQGSAGSYIEPRSSGQAAVGAIVGIIAGALLGGSDQTLYEPGARYPVWGERGYGDPRTDPRFGEQGWGYGSQGQWVSISRRQAWLERRISQGEQQRTLTRSEAGVLRRELSSLITLERRYSAGGLSVRERADLDRRFDALSMRIRLERQDSDGGWSNINQRQAQLDARIDAGVRNGSISNQEATRLRAEFQTIARLEADYRRGGLTNAERADLDRRFDALSARIQSDSRGQDGGWTNINQRQAQLDARIDAGVRNGSISNQEATRLRAEFQTIARLEADYRQGGLTNAERADLDRRFDALSARIQADGRDDDGGWTSIDQRQAALDDRIEAGVRNDSITSVEARRLRDDFDAIARLEADYRQGGLTNAERADLDRRFDALSARIRADGRDDDGGWTSIDQRQAALDDRIEAGVRNGSITSVEARRLRDDFDAIARLEATYRQGGLSIVERADLDRRFNALSARINAVRRDR
jgi:hypothetical protein